MSPDPRSDPRISTLRTCEQANPILTRHSPPSRRPGPTPGWRHGPYGLIDTRSDTLCASWKNALRHGSRGIQVRTVLPVLIRHSDCSVPLPCCSLKLWSISWRSGACHPHILARSCIAPSLFGKFDLAARRVVGLRQPVIDGHFSNGGFQNLHQVLNRLIAKNR